MDKQADLSFEKLKYFLEHKPASQKAVRHLREGVEIGIVIGNQIDCALFSKDSAPILERRAANDPDVIFHISPESVDILSENPGNDVGDFGIALVKEALSGGVQIRIPGNMFSIARNGYISIIKEGGRKFASHLSIHGITGITKIMSVIKSLKKEK